MRIRHWLALVAAVIATPAFAQAGEQVAPSERVESNVVVRQGPSTTSAPLEALEPGETLPLVSEVPFWYQVALPDGSTGYVSKAWTVLVPAGTGFRVHGIDVGTGLAVFVEGPDFTLLYDAGSNDDTRTGANNRAVAYLRAVRPDLTAIDHIVLSHAHRDHLQLLPDVFDRYVVRNAWDSGRLYDSCGYRRFLLRVAAEPGVAFHTAVGSNTSQSYTFAECETEPQTISVPLGPELREGPVQLGAGARMTFLYVDTELHDDPNENSLVLLLELGGRRILLMGDAEAGGRDDPQAAPSPGSIEAELLACCRAALRADVLFAGHHGSKTSSRTAFLDAVGASDYVISSGPYTYSGTSLPDLEVVDELDSRGTLWRTDRDDSACMTDPQKIGRDADGEPGGCDNVLIDISSAGVLTPHFNEIAD